MKIGAGSLACSSGMACTPIADSCYFAVLPEACIMLQRTVLCAIMGRVVQLAAAPALHALGLVLASL
jgi:hypothetical protein